MNPDQCLTKFRKIAHSQFVRKHVDNAIVKSVLDSEITTSLIIKFTLIDAKLKTTYIN